MSIDFIKHNISFVPKPTALPFSASFHTTEPLEK